MNPYGMDLYVQERQRQLLMEAEHQRIWEAARRADDAGAAIWPYRSRVKVVGALRRFVQIAWAW
jgi:hypothetical protein